MNHQAHQVESRESRVESQLRRPSTLLLLLFSFSAFQLLAETPVLFSVRDFTGTTSDRTILVTPDVATEAVVIGTNLVPTVPFRLQTRGGMVQTNLVSWGYAIRIDGWPKAAHILVPDTNVLQNAASLVSTNPFAIPTLGNAANFYTKMEVDALLSTNGVGIASLGLLTSNLVWVAGDGGSDTTGRREDPLHPFLTCHAAESNALPNDTIVVLRGRYVEQGLGSANWLVSQDAVIGSTNLAGPIFTATAESYSVGGLGLIEAATVAISAVAPGAIRLDGVTVSPSVGRTNNVTGSWRE